MEKIKTQFTETLSILEALLVALLGQPSRSCTTLILNLLILVRDVKNDSPDTFFINLMPNLRCHFLEISYLCFVTPCIRVVACSVSPGMSAPRNSS